MASVRLPGDWHDQLQAMAASQHRTVSQELRMLVERHLQNASAKQAA